jgi:hypothetical protein
MGVMETGGGGDAVVNSDFCPLYWADSEVDGNVCKGQFGIPCQMHHRKQFW